ncbi:G2/mitotic-specific cyclin-A-like [Planoprotostelium fungivorum]|uniref:G2/mitotic-specific cyclin-A-like n=1 Tax=Planoprotostelium fungivorum TaxID=1890364 RepID=A0A2P6NXB2_9EUKA|nr:G2/mitotic-specific cyclin-A-like [Planoprotostelium fungivorum]
MTTDRTCDFASSNTSEMKKVTLQHLQVLETQQLPMDDFVSAQRELSRQDRRILVDWLVDVCDEYECPNEVFYLSIKLMDRFFYLRRNTSRGEFQLLAVSSFALSCKLIRGWEPSIVDLSALCEDIYSHDLIRAMQYLQLNILSFQIQLIHPLHFLDKFTRAAKCDKFSRHLSQYLCELSMLSSECQMKKPSLLAASAVYAAQKMLGIENPWTQFPGCCVEDLLIIGRQLLVLFQEQANEAHCPSSQPCDALYRKYSSASFFSVSRLLPLLF